MTRLNKKERKQNFHFRWKIRFQVVFAALLSIKPTSTEPERAFSIMGYFCTKIRNRLSDEALDAMVFMRQYLKNQREKNSQNSQTSKNNET